MATVNPATILSKSIDGWLYLLVTWLGKKKASTLGVFLVSRAAVGFDVRVSVLPAQGMHWRQQRDIGPHKDIVANRHRTAVNTGEVEVGESPLPNRSETAVVELHRSLQVERIPLDSEPLERFLALGIILQEVVVFLAQAVSLGSEAG